MKRKLKQVEAPALLKLDLGCGKNKQSGFFGVDSRQFDGVDKVLDLTKPWPWGDDSVDEVHSSHFVEHLDAEERTRFFNELYRVLKKDAKATIITPHWSSDRAYGDLTHKWPPVVAFFWYYVDKGWREANAPHVGLTCDFQVTWAFIFGPPWNSRAPEAQAFAVNHYTNVVQDMSATLTKR
jgi:hypothetical protein